MESVKESIGTDVIETKPKVISKEKPKRRRKRRIYTKYEDELLTKVLDKKPRERKKELERLADLFQVPFLTLRHRFYTVIKKRADAQKEEEAKARAQAKAEATTKQSLKQPETKEIIKPDLVEVIKPSSQQDPMEELLTLPGRVAHLKKRLYGMLDLKGFVDRLIDIQHQLEREQQLLEELTQKERLIERIKSDVEKKIERMNIREKELDDLYKQLEVTLHQFMNLSSIDKLKVLGDFTIKIETVVDRFGNIVRRRPIVVP